MPKIIAIANQKGGVAKTTTCLNLGHAIAERGQKVLLVDLDPQSSLTISLGLDVRELPATIYDVLLDTKPGISIKDIIRPTSMGNVHIAPASIDLGLLGERNVDASLLAGERRQPLDRPVAPGSSMVRASSPGAAGYHGSFQGRSTTSKAHVERCWRWRCR